MKINHKFIKVLLLIFLGGCTEKLDLYPLNQITEGNFYKNENEINLAVNDIYRRFSELYKANGIPDLYGELYSDNTYIKLTDGGNNFLEQITDYYISSDNGRIETAWNNCYSSIYTCNNLLEILKDTDIISESEKEIIRGQITLVRALFYFNMVQVWGNIPYVDKKITPDESYSYVNVDANLIYENLISDLKFCKEVLPESYAGEDVGRVTRYGAAAILAKLYMTIGDNESAKTELEFIINSGKYSLDANNDGAVNTDDIKHLFDPSTKNCKSSILEAQYLAGENTLNANHQSRYTPYSFSFHLPGQTGTFRGGGQNTPSDDLLNEFENEDPRKEISYQEGYTDLSSGEFVNFPYTMKFYDPDYQYPGQNFEVIRYADILLMYAEVTNDPQYLNQVRARAGLSAYGSTEYPSETYSSLDLAIEHERRVELCFEFHRFFDLKRTGRALEVMSAKGYDIDQNKLLFPIPLNTIDINPDITQNPGY